MPKVTGTRKQRALELKSKIENGPSFGIGFPFSSQVTTKEANTEATEEYKRWALSWIIPELVDLIPELKNKLDKRT